MDEPARWNPTPEALLAEHGWARRLARRLLGGDGAAEDLAQEACLRALDRRDVRSPRAWVAGVVRNLAREHGRERGRRERRERSVARPEAQPSAADALERLAVQQEVVRAVLALEEPYRSTIVLRFYEDLPPRRIAVRQGVPVATVKSRLLRGLAELRARLRSEHGGDARGWALFLAPLAFPPRPGAVAGTALAATLGAATLALVLWQARATDDAAVTRLVQDSNASTEAHGTVEEALPVLPAARRAAPEGPASPALETLAFETRSVAGRVLDLAGEPVAGVALTLRESHGAWMDTEGGGRLWSEWTGAPLPQVLGDALGRFTLELPADFSGAVVSADPRFETVLCPQVYLDPGQEAVVLVAPRIDLRGLVRDTAGNALPGAELRLDLPDGLHARLAADLTRSLAVGWSTRSGVDGRFALSLPAVPGAVLRARLAPFAEQRLVRDPWLDEELELVLSEPDGARVEGVVEAGSEAVAGATVVLGHHSVESGPDGRFSMPLAGNEQAEELCALAAGFLPARAQGDVGPDGSVRWPSFVRLVVAQPSLALAGRVTDAVGQPLAGHRVWLTDGTLSHADAQGFPKLLESVLAGQDEMRHGATTDAEGRFRIAGLEARAYRLQAVDPRTALVVEDGPFEAGREDVELRYPAGALHARVSGTVRSRAGEPLGGLFVHVARETGFVLLDERGYGFEAVGARGQTDERGRFELQDVPREGVTLRVGGTGITQVELALGPGVEPEGLELVAGARVRLQVAVHGALARAERFVCLDGTGRPVPLATAMEGGTRISPEQELVGGCAPAVALDDSARTLVLYAGDEELARMPLVLRAGELNRLDL